MIPLINQLVKVLYKIFPQPQADLVAPLYLNDAVAEFPDTLVETVRKTLGKKYGNEPPAFAKDRKSEFVNLFDMPKDEFLNFVGTFIRPKVVGR